MSDDPARDAALEDAQALLKSLREWKAGPEHTEPVEREIERLGIAGDFEVHEDNMEAVGLFLALGTQWRMLPTFAGAIPQGLDYAAVESVLRLAQLRPARRRLLFTDLRVMENAALVAMSEQREAARRVAEAQRTGGAQ